MDDEFSLSEGFLPDNFSGISFNSENCPVKFLPKHDDLATEPLPDSCRLYQVSGHYILRIDICNFSQLAGLVLILICLFHHRNRRHQSVIIHEIVEKVSTRVSVVGMDSRAGERQDESRGSLDGVPTLGRFLRPASLELPALFFFFFV